MRPRATAVAVLTLVAVSACSGGDALVAPPTTPTAPPTTGDGPPPTSVAPAATTAAAAETTAAPAPADDSESTEPTAAPVTTIVDVAEVGVPGLDSDDAFCAAWSRFGGSWQVLLVASVFGADEARVAELEVVAAPLVALAYDALVTGFPPQLESEAEVVAEDYFGVFARRSSDALESLREAGATDAQLARLVDVWTEALADRDPAAPLVDVDLSGELDALVQAAAEQFRTRRIGLSQDPSMIVSAETPATDTYLETSCPDQGALTGQEIPEGP